MKRPRRSILALMTLTSGIAVDCAWARYNLTRRESLLGLYAPAFDAGVWPLATLLLLALPQVGRLRGRPRHFLIGFEACGLASLLGFVAINWACRLDPTGVALHRAVTLTLQPVYKSWDLVG